MIRDGEMNLCMSVVPSAWQYGTVPDKRFYSLTHCEEGLVLLIQNRGTYLQKNLERKIQKIIERDVSDGLFAQPIGIYVEWNTFIVVDSLLRS